VPLDEQGRWEARALAGRLAAEPIGVCHTSDLARATETLDLLLAGRSPRPPVHPCRALRELDFGEWEGRTYQEIAAEPLGSAVLAGEVAPPEGEALTHLAARIGAFWRRLCQQAEAVPDGTILVVSHGGPLRVLLCLALGLPAVEHWRFQVDHGSLSELVYAPEVGARLVCLNDTCHLSLAAELRKERMSR
jgi:broad specificity phosphatase PhoE